MNETTEMRIETRSCATHLECPSCLRIFDLFQNYDRTQWGHCEDCGNCLDVKYDYDRATDLIHSIPLDERPLNVWFLEELLPVAYFDSREITGHDIGGTPLVHAKRLGAELGLKNLYIKNDGVNRPSHSYKDRVCGMAIARALDIEATEIGCVSTGNVGNSIAALAARAGLHSVVFYPEAIEKTKALISAAYGSYVVQAEGNYDEVNKTCREVIRHTGLNFANINLRPFYSEGAKTVAYEIVQQLGWEAPDHIVLPAAGGTLSSRVDKGLQELVRVGLADTRKTRLSIAQPLGCAPIAYAIQSGTPLVPVLIRTMAYSLAIGKPGDGQMVIDAVDRTGGAGVMPEDNEIFNGIDLLARTEGILTEPAGGTTIAGLKILADQQFFGEDEVVVAVVTGSGLKTIADYHTEYQPRWNHVYAGAREFAMQIEGARWGR